MLEINNEKVNVNWLEILENLNRKGNNVWGTLTLNGKVIGVQKIRQL